MVDIKALKPAKRYSNAFFETVSDKNADSVLKEIDFFLETLNSNKEFKNFIFHPVVSLEDKKDTINKVFTFFSKETLNFISILLEEGRLSCLDEIRDFLFEKNNNKNNVKLVEVTLAIEPSFEMKEYIAKRLEAKMSSSVSVNFKKDESLLGGALFKIKDTLVDLSIKKKLENFKQI